MDKEENTPFTLDSLCYISDHPGFFGTIKNCPADFVVTEIDINGRLVTKEFIKGTEQSNNESDFQERCKKQKTGQRRTELKKKTSDGLGVLDSSTSGTLSLSTDNNYVDTIDDICKTEADNLLNPMLGSVIQDSLNHFASSIKSAWKSQIARDHPAEFSLGVFPDKIERANIHSVVRQTFPFLITVTKSTELLVKPNLDYRELCQLTSEEEADEFFKFLDAKIENSRFTFQPDECKEHRTAVHHFISKRFGKLVETKSFSEKGTNSLQKVSITVRFRERPGSSRKRHRIEGQEVYTAFTLRKENLETLEAISYLSSGLGVLPSDFSYAGIKDKKAITYQAMVVKKVTPERLQQFESSVERKGIKMYNVRPAKQHMRLGQLAGNHFRITVRDVRNHSNDSSKNVPERISEAILSVRTKGFINYYGPQRFGQGQNGQAHDIGLALLKEEMEKSIKMFFSPEVLDDPVNTAKKYFLQTEDAKGTLALMPEYKVRERMLLRALNRYGMNHEGCVRGWLSIPHSMRIFYIHSYCSKVWNEAASFRIMSYGSKVVEGDLVLCDQNTNEKSSLSDRVHVVTATEEETNIYSIHQIVLPMPGHSILYPTNKVGRWYTNTLAKAGLTTCRFRVPALQLNIPGCYRNILKFARNLSYELLLENQKQAEKMENVPGTEVTTSNQSVVVKFDLDSSCYATICLREMMKCNF
ncbi:pseudouridylate synthase PUS7L [Discoglossus pictus]